MSALETILACLAKNIYLFIWGTEMRLFSESIRNVTELQESSVCSSDF